MSGRYYTGVFRGDSTELFKCAEYHYAPPLFMWHSEAQDYVDKCLTAAEKAHAKIRRVWVKIEIMPQVCVEFVRLDGEATPEYVCSRCGFMKSAHEAKVPQ